MSNTGWAAVTIILVLLLGGGWWYMSSQTTPTTTDTAAGVGGAAGTFPEGTPEPNNGMVGGDAAPGENAANTVIVNYTANGFSPQSVTVSAGQAVRFVNQTSARMWVGADEHPTHTEYDGSDRATHCSGTYTGPTPFDQCEAGSEYTFVFAKAGTFGYHNHAAAEHGGTVIVQ